MKNINTLARELDFSNAEEYYIYCIDSYINGQLDQCRNLFKAMKYENKKEFLTYIVGENIGMIDVYDFYFELL